MMRNFVLPISARFNLHGKKTFRYLRILFNVLHRNYCRSRFLVSVYRQGRVIIYGKTIFSFLFIEFIVYWGGGCCSRKILLHVCDCYFIKIVNVKALVINLSEYRRVMDWRTSLLFFFLPLFQRKVPDLFLFFNFFFFFLKDKTRRETFSLIAKPKRKNGWIRTPGQCSYIFNCIAD